jgi:hypothetical protein
MVIPQIRRYTRMTEQNLPYVTQGSQIEAIINQIRVLSGIEIVTHSIYFCHVHQFVVTQFDVAWRFSLSAKLYQNFNISKSVDALWNCCEPRVIPSKTSPICTKIEFPTDHFKLLSLYYSRKTLETIPCHHVCHLCNIYASSLTKSNPK